MFLKEVYQCLSSEEIQEQIDIRLQLMSEMVGSLYPAILHQQICEFREALKNE